MGSKVFLPRRHYFEVNDQPWFPQTLREKVQDYLTLGWINRLPILQPTSPAALVSRVLSTVLGPRVSDYVYVDFASGAGGPTPYIESHLNQELRDAGKEDVKFVLTDISPHVSAWTAIAKKSQNINYIAQSVDATNAPSADTLLKDVPGVQGKKIMRLFSLSFHHFDDDLAAKVLENTIETADGFCIFELQSRHLTSFVLVSLLWPLAMLITPFYFWNSPWHLFFTYLVPIVPFIWVYDGYISCLRTRTPEEVEALLRSRSSTEKLAGWKFISGQTRHTWPIGWLYWIICYNNE
ncbi:hypothetical protein A1O3_03976 [Capronia epimyces CBS 606.96]|uniref:Methyltransferase domain-containing protein n=1 Tax=Capronia epimyces CBS 606.96 TaxID=1182542 RepID=W9YXJ7_9EURO|nr:uncharacterized protein A1O3_03976 [Capronia epimyces CBS 606.96]EXJ87019.1 hypothetical protein A1O3_03976 [Capronia epimyces CBS 606.96]